MRAGIGSGVGARITVLATRTPLLPYPFSAIVGQEDLKLALLLNAVSPEVGGVLVRGEKGTAKSTAVRALARLLPPIGSSPAARTPATPSPEPRVPGGAAPGGRAVGEQAGAARGVAGRGEHGPAGGDAGHREGALGGEEGVRAGAARGGAQGHPVRGRGEPALRPPRGPSARRGGDGREPRRARGRERAAPLALYPGRDDEPRGGRAHARSSSTASASPSRSRGAPTPPSRVEVVRRRLRYEADPRGVRRRMVGRGREARPRRRGSARGGFPASAWTRTLLYRISDPLRRARAWTACAATW